MGDGTGCDNMTCIIVKFKNLSVKRKADSINSNNSDYIESESVKPESDSNPEPDQKRIKITVEEVKNTETDGTEAGIDTSSNNN